MPAAGDSSMTGCRRTTFVARVGPGGLDAIELAWFLLGAIVLYAPTYWTLARTVWASDEQGHGPIILVLSLWLVWRRRHELDALPARPTAVPGWACLVSGLLLYVVGRSQTILFLEVGSQLFVLAACLLFIRGPAALRLLWFPMFFLLFMIPLPSALVAAVTTPLKAAVSLVATNVLHHAGYPVARSGVVFTIGPYQLLVADACAGLNSIFTLEALGLLYLNVMRYSSAARNLLIALMVVPIAFVANVARVVILALVTFYFGDAAGQGFVHGFAGMVLFLVGLTLLLAFDSLLATRLVPSGRAS